MASLGLFVNQFMKSMLKVHANSSQAEPRASLEAKLNDAVKADNLDKVKALIARGADVNASFRQETAFTRAVEIGSYNAADVIIAAATFDPRAPNQFNRTPIFVAAKQGRVDYVNRLLQMGADPNASDIRLETPLAATAWPDAHEVAEILIQHGANINAIDAMGQTALFRACSSVSVGVVKVLVNHKCDVNKATPNGQTPLMAAMPSFYNSKVARKKISNMLLICKLLIQAGCDLNSQDIKGKTALHSAVERNDTYGLCLLAESDCDLEIRDSLGYTPFHSAIGLNRPHYDLARYLLHYGADGTLPMKNPRVDFREEIIPLTHILLHRPPSDEADMLWSRAVLLRTLCDVVLPYRDPDLQTSLGMEAGARSEPLKFHEVVEREVMQRLNASEPCSLLHLSRLRVRNTLGSKNHMPRISALPIAPAQKQYLLLGIRPEWISLSKIFELHRNIVDCNNDRVSEIVESGVDLNMFVDNKTPLALALQIKNIDAAEMLLKSEPRPRLTWVNSSGDTALHIAARHGVSSFVSKIVELNAVVQANNQICAPLMEVTNTQGHTPLMDAVKEGHFETMAELIKHGARVDNYIGRDMTLLHLATASGNVDAVEILLKAGADLNAQDKWGNTPLHVVAEKGRTYLQNNVSLPAMYDHAVLAALDEFQFTMRGAGPTLTRDARHRATVVCLLEKGADPKTLNTKRQSPRDLAALYSYKDILDILSRARGKPE